MAGKYHIISLVACALLIYEARADTYIVLPDDSPDQGLSSGESDFDTSIDGLDTPVILAEEIKGKIVAPIEFALVADSADEWRSNLDSNPNTSRRILSLKLYGGVFNENVTVNNFFGIGNCDARASQITFGGKAGDSRVEVEIDYTSPCGSDLTIPRTIPPSAKDALDNSIAVSFIVELSNSNLNISYFLSPTGLASDAVAFGATSSLIIDDSGKLHTGKSLISRAPAFLYETSGADEKIINATTKSNYNLVDMQDLATFTVQSTDALKADLKTPVSYLDIASATVTIQYENLEGLDIAQITQINPRTSEIIYPVVAGTNISYEISSFFGLNPDEAKLSLAILPDENPETQIQSQDVEVILRIDFEDENMADPSPLVLATAKIQREVLSFGPYEWVGDKNRWGLSVFRFTGMPDNPPPLIRAYVKNSNFFSGQKESIVDYPDHSHNGEIILNSIHLTDALGEFGRGDITFEIEFVDSTQYDVLIQRIIYTASGSVVTMPDDYSVDGYEIQ